MAEERDGGPLYESVRGSKDAYGDLSCCQRYFVDDANGDNAALEVICRVFDDWEPVYERWLKRDKTEFFWWGRALGAFIRNEIEGGRNGPV